MKTMAVRPTFQYKAPVLFNAGRYEMSKDKLAAGSSVGTLISMRIMWK